MISPDGELLASIDAGDGVVSAEVDHAPRRRAASIPSSLQLSVQAFEPAELAVRAPAAIPLQPDLRFDLAALRMVPDFRIKCEKTLNFAFGHLPTSR